MQEYIKDWTNYTLTIPSDRGDLTVKWSDVNELAKWSNMQAGLYLQNQTSSLQLFFEHFPRWYNMFWGQRHRQGIFNGIPDGSKIIDIGSGVGVIDLLLYSYIPNSKFWLIDKEGFAFKPGVYYDPNYPEYNSWAPVVDAISTSGFDPDRFTMQGPDVAFPEDVDCITSYLSWGWHYPKDTYWKQVMGSLKTGGRLVMDIRVLADRDVVGEITEDMKSEPMLHAFDIKLPDHVDAMPSPDPSKPLGYRAMWIKKS